MPAIAHAREHRLWVLTTGDESCYVLHRGDDDLLHGLHWGPALTVDQAITLLDYPPPRPRSCEDPRDGTLDLNATGGARYSHAGLQVRFPDGTRVLDPRLTGHDATDDTLILTFEDTYYPLAVETRYRVHADAWVTASPNPWTGRAAPLDYRFRVAAAGALGIGVDLAACDAAELARITELISTYKAARHLVQHDVLHRLGEPGRDALTGVQHTAHDGGETVVPAYYNSRRFGRVDPDLPLRALDPQARCRDLETDREHHGAVLLTRGLPLDLPAGEHASALLHLRRVGPSEKARLIPNGVNQLP